MRAFLEGLISRFRIRPKLKPAELQAAFRGHYRDFRALLTANNNALELMAEMEQALGAGRPFGMAFVRGNCTALCVNVYKMIHHLTRLADGRYAELDRPFRAITRSLEEVIAHRTAPGGGDMILPMAAVDRNSIDQVGEKMANLGEAANRLGLAVPAGFVITAAAARHFLEANRLQPEIDRRLKGLKPDNLEELYTVSAGIQNLISNAPLPADLEEAIHHHYQKMAESAGHEVAVALRSSALGEDGGATSSFAGQYRTQLHVGRELLSRTYKEIVAGKYLSQAIVYRQQRGYRHQDVQMCVGCLAMVAARVSGVLYSRAPDDPRSSWLLIQAAGGLANQVVDGRSASIRYRLGRLEPFLPLDPPSAEAADLLTPQELARLGRAAIRLEEHFGSPQDIEWSIDRDGTLFILQSRPLACRQETDPALEPVATDLPPPLLQGGLCAARGVGAGEVFVVRSSLDLLAFPKGAVLVVETPYPDWASLLDRAAAVVSETGQPAAHLATVSREFGVPALFGLAGAATALSNGRLVTVDATAARIYEGRVEPLLALAAPRPNLMAGSPIFNILTGAMTHITPLNLTDPASPFFSPDSCRTLHDLTRFCHEKAVVEMFNFGERYGFDDKAAKQLVVTGTPYQWWVIDLDDGFVPDFNPESRYVHIEHIVSVPMRAIWQGMTAFPWAGPPPVSLRGFGSIIFQSTRNPNLDPAVRSSFAAKNYFLISKNYCNLSVRLGYHFALAEANLGEYLTENYVNFQFKGGAADESRRLVRVELIGGILKEFGFRVEQKVDAISARIEKKPADYLLGRLKILGYLLIHTRQIDMVMGDAEMVGRYRQKIMSELPGLLGQPEEKEEADAT